jgi:hypothetical protein
LVWRSPGIGAYSEYPFAGLALTFLPLVFAWRSPERYFALLPALALVALILTLRGSPASRRLWR